jgi:hypothetical protein
MSLEPFAILPLLGHAVFAIIVVTKWLALYRSEMSNFRQASGSNYKQMLLNASGYPVRILIDSYVTLLIITIGILIIQVLIVSPLSENGSGKSILELAEPLLTACRLWIMFFVTCIIGSIGIVVYVRLIDKKSLKCLKDMQSHLKGIIVSQIILLGAVYVLGSFTIFPRLIK